MSSILLMILIVYIFFVTFVAVGKVLDVSGVSKRFGGLQALIADNPTTGTVGGINAANATLLDIFVHEFSPQGVTGVAVRLRGTPLPYRWRCAQWRKSG